MDLKTILWYLVLTSLTVAYLVVLAGVRAAKSHDVSHHSHRMIVGCTIVGIWLVAYVLKQSLFGRDSLNGPETDYWSIYIHMLLTLMFLSVRHNCNCLKFLLFIKLLPQNSLQA